MTKWKEPAVPRVVVQMIPIDHTGHMLVMHRSDKVRSAKNCWSFPSGLQHCGERFDQCACRELQEEYGLVGNRVNLLGVYENIAGDAESEEQYHWVILVAGIRVSDIGKAVNKEPDRHDLMKVVPIEAITSVDFFDQHKFHISFDAFARQRGVMLAEKLRAMIED